MLDVGHKFAARLMALTLLEHLNSGLYILSERKYFCLYLPMLCCRGQGLIMVRTTRTAAQGTKI
jgi:hypothetical protein